MQLNYLKAQLLILFGHSFSENAQLFTKYVFKENQIYQLLMHLVCDKHINNLTQLLLTIVSEKDDKLMAHRYSDGNEYRLAWWPIAADVKLCQQITHLKYMYHLCLVLDTLQGKKSYQQLILFYFIFAVGAIQGSRFSKTAWCVIVCLLHIKL